MGRSGQRERQHNRHRHRSRSDSKEKHYNRRQRSRSDSKQRRRSRQHRDHSRQNRQKIHHTHRSSYDHYERPNYNKRRSQSNESQQYYEGKQIQKMQQKIRLAIRSRTLQYDQQALKAFSQMSQRKQQQVTEQARSIERVNECILVRQLFISGLNDMNQYSVTQLMGKYGEIQKIQIIKDFAFVKYYRVQDASNACADYHNINASLQQFVNSNFKIFFADHLKRWNVVANHPDYQIKQHLIPILYVSVKNDPQYANQKYLRSIFSKYGYIRNIQFRKNQLPGPKVHVNIEYETIEQALRARDKLRYQKQRFGQKKSQIAILIDSQKITKIHPNVSNQIRFQKKRLQNIGTNITSSINMVGNMNMGNNNMSSMNPIIPSSGSYNDLNSIQSYQSNYMRNTTLSMAPNIPSQQANSYQTQDIFAMLQKLNQNKSKSQNIQIQQQQQYQSDWVGFFTRNQQFKVEVCFNKIHKNVPFELQSILNVSHRGDIQEVLNRTDYILAGKFKAANKLNYNSFNAYIKYFINKNKAGIIFTQSYLIYLIPYKQQLNLPYQVSQNQMLALFFKISN